MSERVECVGGPLDGQWLSLDTEQVGVYADAADPANLHAYRRVGPVLVYDGVEPNVGPVRITRVTCPEIAPGEVRHVFVATKQTCLCGKEIAPRRMPRTP